MKGPGTTHSRARTFPGFLGGSLRGAADHRASLWPWVDTGSHLSSLSGWMTQIRTSCHPCCCPETVSPVALLRVEVTTASDLPGRGFCRRGVSLSFSLRTRLGGGPPWYRRDGGRTNAGPRRTSGTPHGSQTGRSKMKVWLWSSPPPPPSLSFSHPSFPPPHPSIV